MKDANQRAQLGNRAVVDIPAVSIGEEEPLIILRPNANFNPRGCLRDLCFRGRHFKGLVITRNLALLISGQVGKLDVLIAALAHVVEQVYVGVPLLLGSDHVRVHGPEFTNRSLSTSSTAWELRFSFDFLLTNRPGQRHFEAAPINDRLPNMSLVSGEKVNNLT